MWIFTPNILIPLRSPKSVPAGELFVIVNYIDVLIDVVPEILKIWFSNLFITDFIVHPVITLEMCVFGIQPSLLTF